jgi:hypothetical protein
MKTAIRDFPSAEKASVASWVLSPSSAKKIVAKVVKSSFKSMIRSSGRHWQEIMERLYTTSVGLTQA